MLRNHGKSNTMDDEQEYIEPLDMEDWRDEDDTERNKGRGC